jgi:hypothetical protein
MKLNIKKFICIIFVNFLILSTVTGIMVKSNAISDFDPLVDIEITVEIQKIRAFDKDDQQLNVREYIDSTSDPDFYVKIIINNQEYTSNIWHDSKYIYGPDFSAALNVPDDEEFVIVKIQLWDWNDDGDVLCDIGDETDDVELEYSVKTGHWTGDDHLEDPSGYGRLNGCDDGSIYLRDLDCELWFDIYQNDYDNDGVPYWIEVNEFGTDPELDNSGDDIDEDDVSFEWEWKWGYNPIMTDDHKGIDPENDGIDNYEEYLTSEWFSDPYRKDLFVELDQMENPQINGYPFPDASKELLLTAYDRQNVVYHLDDSSEMIPFEESTGSGELNIIYQQYFIQEDDAGWRRSVFHYGVVLYQSSGGNGFAFGPNRFQISSNGMEENQNLFSWLKQDIVYASAYMHETGHSLIGWPIPGHNQWSYYPWQLGWWLSRPYKSCMNYGYMFTSVDYSDGSRPFGDYDDWERMDLTAFQQDW